MGANSNYRETIGLPALDRNAAKLLLDAASYAEECQVDAWEFAVDVQELLRAGLSGNDLRWLVFHKLAKHGVESSARGKRRRFRILANLNLPANSCVVLTEAGVAALSRQLKWKASGELPDSETSNEAIHARPPGGGPGSRIRRLPRWDESSRELFLGKTLVKRLLVPADSQEQVLREFERQLWPHSIINPLKPKPGTDTKRRLNDAIRGLNSSQQRRLIIFRSNGRGHGVRWEFASNNGAQVSGGRP